MSDAVSNLLEAAMKLSDVERAELAEALYDGLDSDIDELTDEEFNAELERRRKELIDDPSSGIPWSELKKEMM